VIVDSRDRRAALLASTSYNGIDFVEIADDAQTALRVHFFNEVPLAGTLVATPTRPAVTIEGGETIRTVAVDAIDDAHDWSVEGSHLVLRLAVEAPGDFSRYALAIRSDRLDPYFARSQFSFKARCPSDLDCLQPPVECPTTPPDPLQINYLAKDFLGFRQALLDFSAQRYPEWQERSEADFGVMFMEALCALGDDLSYTQDRVAAEATLVNATQRRSVARLAHLVDYWPRPAISARVLLQVEVDDATTSIADGLVFSAVSPDGVVIPFETGPALAERTAAGARVRSAWNVLRPYWFDDRDRCLRRGATEMYILGDGLGLFPGQRILIETAPATDADPPIRQIVTLVEARGGLCDPLFEPPPSLGGQRDPPITTCASSLPHGTAVTQLRWGTEDALAVDRDLTRTTLSGNLVAATQGRTQPVEQFTIPGDVADPHLTPAVARTGPNDAPDAPSLEYQHTLQTAPLAWLASDDPEEPPRPEIELEGVAPREEEAPWTFVPWLLAAGPFDDAFTIDPVRFRRLPGAVEEPPRFEYDGEAGDTIRFGFKGFASIPLEGTVFSATYRVSAGAAGNVAAGAVTRIEPGAAGVLRVTNPLPARGGAEPEPLDRVRKLAPEEFRARTYRAVLPRDYEQAAETLPWVQRAGTVFRWTGSWLTVFTTPDPMSGEQVTVDERTQLIDLLNRYRMAGYESYVPEPRYLSLDVAIELCATADAFRGEVEQAVLVALRPRGGGFFHPDHFTFGGPLERSGLAAAVQGCPGVDGVRCIRYRVRGRTHGYVEMGDTVPAGADEIIRCDDDPSLPERGSLEVVVRGGK
jgi:hypothetical protein